MASATQKLVVLCTDFGLHGPYTGQMHAVLQTLAPGVPIVNLFADLPVFNFRAAAYLIAAYAPEFPKHSVFVCVVDPGVGSWKHSPVIVAAGERWFVGPQNGLFNIVAYDNPDCAMWPIEWRPERLSASFHGRDIYAPTAARLVTGQLELGPAQPLHFDQSEWPLNLAEVIYVDHYGNAITGLRAANLSKDAVLELNGQLLCHAECFSAIPLRSGCWYANSNGLVEVAVNCGRAVDVLHAAVGTAISIVERKPVSK